MSGTTTIVPVTQAEATQTNITYASKVGKQVLKHQLKKQRVALEEELAASKEVLREAMAGNMFTRMLSTVAKAAVEADPKLTTMRNILNELLDHDFEEEHALSSNWNLINGEINDSYILEQIRGEAYYNHEETWYIKSVVEKGYIELKIELPMEFCIDQDHGTHVSPTYILKVNLDDEWKVRIATVYECRKKNINIRKDMIRLDLKLADIDNLVEEMEAKLLVRELQSSSEGKAVLDIASSMVQDMLDGNLPPLLEEAIDKL